jgi:hypothetical protein
MIDQSISEINIKRIDDETIEISGELQATASTFLCRRTGEGNATTYTFSFSGGQYDFNEGGLSFTVVGEWEMGEVARVCEIMSRSDDKLIN